MPYCPSCHPTNSVKALKGQLVQLHYYMAVVTLSLAALVIGPVCGSVCGCVCLWVCYHDN